MAFSNTAKQVTALIGKVDGRTLRAAIQQAAVHVVGHAMQHGHSPLVIALSDRMELSPMLRKLQKPLVSFLTKNGPFTHGAKGFEFSKAKRDALVEEGYTWEAFESEAPAWDDEAKAAPKDEALDLVKAVESLIAKANKKIGEGKCLDADLAPRLGALLGQYVGRKVVEAASVSSKAQEAPQEAQEAVEA